MLTPTYTVTCTRKRVIAKDVYEIVLTKPEGFVFKPGQFVLFDVPLIDNPTDIQTRAYSIASAPSEPELLFVIKLVPGGRASRWLVEFLQEGSEVVIKGPFGNFLLTPPAPSPGASRRSSGAMAGKRGEGRLLFIATGTGIAPFRSQIVDALEKGDTRKIDIIFGVRAEEDLFWMEELQALTRKYPQVFFHPTLTVPSKMWTGHTCRVQALAPKLVKEFANTIVYACGNPDMTKEVKTLATTEWGMDRKAVHVEGYI